MKSIKSRKIAAEANNLTVENRVKEILDAIRNVGKKALLKFIKELDGYDGPLKIEKEQMDKALETISVELRRSIERAISNIRAFHKAQKTLLNKMALDTEKGVTAGKDPAGLAAAAVYIAALLSGERRTQKEIAHVAGVTEVTVRNRYKELAKELGIELPSQ